MSRNAKVVLAIFLALGSSGLSASAFAHGRGHGGGDSFRANHFGGRLGDTPGYGYGGYGNRAGGDGARDVWGHWGSYYGPMVPSL